MKNKMSVGWYLNGDRAWLWNGKRFTDWVNGDALQMSCGEWTEDESAENAQELHDATGQVGDVFVSLRGPFAFDEICDGRKLLTP